jgi:hypothetical protein
MNPLTESQELVHRFNEDEAVWRAFETKRTWRRLLGSAALLAEEMLDWLDWQAAERECRAVRAIGFFQP